MKRTASHFFPKRKPVLNNRLQSTLKNADVRTGREYSGPGEKLNNPLNAHPAFPHRYGCPGTIIPGPVLRHHRIMSRGGFSGTGTIPPSSHRCFVFQSSAHGIFFMSHEGKASREFSSDLQQDYTPQECNQGCPGHSGLVRRRYWGNRQWCRTVVILKHCRNFL